MDGSVALSYGPGGFAYTVVPGRNPFVHVAPPSVEVT